MGKYLYRKVGPNGDDDEGGEGGKWPSAFFPIIPGDRTAVPDMDGKYCITGSIPYLPSHAFFSPLLFLT